MLYIVGKKGILSSYACVINVVLVCWILHVFDDNENAEALPLNISSQIRWYYKEEAMYSNGLILYICVVSYYVFVFVFSTTEFTE